MARVIVATENTEGQEPEVVMEERLVPLHLQDGAAADQFVERLGWAISDAEERQTG